MKQSEKVYRELLYCALEKKIRTGTQKEIAERLQLSLSTINQSIKPLRRMGAVEVKLRSLVITDPLKLLYHWASLRNVEKDIIYKTRVEKPIRVIEAEMPAETVFGAYTAYKLQFKDAPADYSEVYVYGDTNELKKRFPPQSGVPNLFVLKMEDTERYGKKTSLAQTFVDLWNLKEWYAKEFLLALEKKIKEIV
ncbi:MAG: winged helix-turn-helix domain-containing protein [Nanoarchaeota archaeon]